MNRTVALPAICSMIAFGAFYAGRLGSYGVSAGAASVDHIEFARPPAQATDAQGLVRALVDEYQSRFRKLESAPHAPMSRASVRWPKRTPVYFDFAIAPKSAEQESPLVAATISIHRQGSAAVVLPCVVDVATREIFVFQSHRWLTAQAWLESVGGV